MVFMQPLKRESKKYITLFFIILVASKNEFMFWTWTEKEKGKLDCVVEWKSCYKCT